MSSRARLPKPSESFERPQITELDFSNLSGLDEGDVALLDYHDENHQSLEGVEKALGFNEGQLREVTPSIKNLLRELTKDALAVVAHIIHGPGKAFNREFINQMAEDVVKSTYFGPDEHGMMGSAYPSVRAIIIDEADALQMHQQGKLKELLLHEIIHFLSGRAVRTKKENGKQFYYYTYGFQRAIVSEEKEAEYPDGSAYRGLSEAATELLSAYVLYQKQPANEPMITLAYGPVIYATLVLFTYFSEKKNIPLSKIMNDFFKAYILGDVALLQKLLQEGFGLTSKQIGLLAKLDSSGHNLNSIQIKLKEIAMKDDNDETSPFDDDFASYLDNYVYRKVDRSKKNGNSAVIPFARFGSILVFDL